MTLTVADAVRDGSRRLAAAGIDSPRREVRLLLSHLLDLTPEQLLALPDAAVPAPAFAALLDRRAGLEPLAYILGWREFWSLRFRVSPATLIPRPDSETLVEAALAAYPDPGAPLRVLDLGVGAGCLLLSVLHERPNAWGLGIDRVEAAARLARDNARYLGFSSRASFLCGDWAQALGGEGRHDLVLSNPPYVTTGEMASLMPDVARFEPASALDGGASGLDAYRAILAELPHLLNAGGLAVLELGMGQADAVTALAEDLGFQATIRDDLGGIPRAMTIRR